VTEAERIDRKLRRFRRIDASYHAEIRRALERSRAETVDPLKARERYEKLRDRAERKIDRLLPKIKALTNRREELKHARGKG